MKTDVQPSDFIVQKINDTTPLVVSALELFEPFPELLDLVKWGLEGLHCLDGGVRDEKGWDGDDVRWENEGREEMGWR